MRPRIGINTIVLVLALLGVVIADTVTRSSDPCVVAVTDGGAIRAEYYDREATIRAMCPNPR